MVYMTMTKTCLSQQTIIIEPKDGYESKNLNLHIIDTTLDNDLGTSQGYGLTMSLE